MIYPLGTAIAGNANAAGTTELEQLFNDVDDLIKRVADTENPDIRRTRAKVHAKLVIAKNALKNAAHQVRNQPVPLVDMTRVAEFGDDASLNDPERSLGVALLVGLGLGLI